MYSKVIVIYLCVYTLYICIYIYSFIYILSQIIFPYRLLNILSIVPLLYSRSFLVIYFIYQKVTHKKNAWEVS